jgi:peptidoglycan-associated lipoprotein
MASERAAVCGNDPRRGATPRSIAVSGVACGEVAVEDAAFSGMDSQEVEMGRVQVGGARPMTRRCAVLVVIFAFALLPGCSKKKADTEDMYEGSTTTTGVDESDVARGGSLDQYRRGTLGRGEQGPLADVYFAYDSIELSDNAREILRANADWLAENPRARVEVEGHCDSRGTVEYNLALGAKRANAVRDYLVSLGVSSDRITTISYGKELQVCHEETESCWAENRRAHFVVLNQ